MDASGKDTGKQLRVKQGRNALPGPATIPEPGAGTAAVHEMTKCLHEGEDLSIGHLLASGAVPVEIQPGPAVVRSMGRCMRERGNVRLQRL
ncbi:MAG: hypothetical protein NVSMB69_00110 [Novosphingobium sp.]